jgi:hypothetical protein
MDDAAKFFYDRAGYSYPTGTDPEVARKLSASRLAQAEQWARISGYTFQWSEDWEVGSHVQFFGDAYDTEPESCEQVSMVNAEGEVVASLGCVDDADRDYGRVVEAELALEVWMRPVAVAPEHVA